MRRPRDVLKYASAVLPTSPSSAATKIAVADQVLLFSRGEISRAQAMRSLGIGYSELLDRIAVRELPLPRVDDAEADRMADMLVALLEPVAP